MSKEILLNFSRRLREQRLKHGLSQETLAEKAGLHRTYITSIEGQGRNVTLLVINRIASALNIPIKDLLDF